MNGDSPMNGDCPRYCEFLGIFTVLGMVAILGMAMVKEGETPSICLPTFYDIARPCIMLVLSTKPLYELTGTVRQANLGIGRHAPPKMC